jgi:hypothetical protein
MEIAKMSDWNPTHRTRPGVEVIATKEAGSLCMRAYWNIEGDQRTDGLFTGMGFAALFEPIPKPSIVKIPLEVARRIERSGPCDTEDWNALQAAILAAEQEETP